MNAHAHLLSLGWAGPGHPLGGHRPTSQKGRSGLAYDPSSKQQINNEGSSSGRGLVKPLLVSQKKNTFGIGKRSHEPAAGNDWWLKGFEDALQNVGKNGDGEQASAGTLKLDCVVSEGAHRYRGKHAGLYGYFIKGQKMEGTIAETPPKPPSGHKRKSDTFDEEESNDVDSHPSFPANAKPQKKAKSKNKVMKDFEQIGQFFEVRDKGRRRENRRSRMGLADGVEKTGQYLEMRIDKRSSRAKTGADQRRPTSSGENTSGKNNSTRTSRLGREEEDAAPKSAGTDSTGTAMERKAARTADPSPNSTASRGRSWSDVGGGYDPDNHPEQDPPAPREKLRKAERKRRKDLKPRAKLLAVS